jgi:hypothetical protein
MPFIFYPSLSCIEKWWHFVTVSGPADKLLYAFPNLLADLARARSFSFSRLRGSAVVTSESSLFRATTLISSMARLKASSFPFEGA